MLKRCGASARVVENPDQLQESEKIILPGVGAFGYAMQCLRERGFLGILNEKALNEKVPVLGICLGMQLFAVGSDESLNSEGLGWVDARLEKFKPTDKAIKIPHMGWNEVDIKDITHPLMQNLDQSRFYHVHSYHYVGLSKANVIATAHHGYDFPTVVQAQGNVMGVQFHPEKSHRYGLQLLKNFAEY